MNILQTAIENANLAGRTAIIPFITAGFPSLFSFADTLCAIDEAGVDIIEIGVPFSDPVADGPIIEEISRQALHEGVTLLWILDQIRALRGRIKAPLVLMGYANPFYQFGIDKLAPLLPELGVAGLIIPDLPLCESAEWQTALQVHDIALIPLIAPNTSKARMIEYSIKAQGFVYIVSVLGTTGTSNSPNNTSQPHQTILTAKEVFNIPCALGFGLHSPSQIETFPTDVRPHAAIIGSALLQYIKKGGKPQEFLAPFATV